MTITCIPGNRVTITDELFETYPIAWALTEAETGDRLIDVIDLVELDLGLAADENAALVPLVTEIVTGTDSIDPHNAIHLTITEAGHITAVVGLDELDRIARASGNLHAIAAMDIVRSLRGGQPVDLGAVALWLDHQLIYALTETLTLIAEDH